MNLYLTIGEKNKTNSANNSRRGSKTVAENNASQNGSYDERMSEIDNITFLNSPITWTITTFRVILNFILDLPRIIYQNLFIFIILPLSVVAFFKIDGPHNQYKQEAYEFGMFAAWWIGLGVASSIGLGTGLHTFILYLCPFMIKVTIAANECNKIPEFLPNRWTYESFAPWEKYEGEPTIGVLDIYQALGLEAFLWGFGTAIGELPPYFVARAASIAGKKHEELADIENDMNQGTGFMDWFKRVMYKSLKKRAFLVVLLWASIPNPLFDLAGLTCGHFLISFWTFFIATAIGKGWIKVTVQSLMTIVVFSNHMVSRILELVRSISPKAEEFMKAQLEKQRAKLYEAKDPNEQQNILAQIWNYLILIMVLYFVYAFLNAIVQNQLKQDEEDKVKDD